MTKMTGCDWCSVGPEDECSPECPSNQRPWNSTLKRGKPLQAKNPWRPVRKPLAHRSKKMTKIYKTRRILVQDLLDQRPLCEVRWNQQCQRVSVDVHEILPRSQGGNIIGGDANEYLTTCRWCHDQIDRYPQEAHDRGFRMWSWERES
jgi:hypothetical protein